MDCRVGFYDNHRATCFGSAKKVSVGRFSWDLCKLWLLWSVCSIHRSTSCSLDRLLKNWKPDLWECVCNCVERQLTSMFATRHHCRFVGFSRHSGHILVMFDASQTVSWRVNHMIAVNARRLVHYGEESVDWYDFGAFAWVFGFFVLCLFV